MMGKITNKLFGIVEVCDILTPKEVRTEKQILQDAVMKLQNEIARSGAIELKKLSNGNILVKLCLKKRKNKR